jgi:hypothetical protein
MVYMKDASIGWKFETHATFMDYFNTTVAYFANIILKNTISSFYSSLVFKVNL